LRSRPRRVGRVLVFCFLSSLAVAVALSGGCRRAAPPFDLLRLGAPAEADVNGRGPDWLAKQQGKPVRLDDDVRLTLPASPPSRLRYVVDVPPGARLTFACGIPADRQTRPPVEFAVQARRPRGEWRTVFSQLVNPLRRREHRRWLPFEVDLAGFAGRGTELLFETRGFERDDDARRAFWGAPAVTSARAQAPLAIIYLVDTLRADHTGVYGYARDTTPRLDAFARDAVVFEQAVAHASWTKPSVASLMTSLLPGQHEAVQLRDPLDERHVTLSEMLKAKGYATGAAVANAVIFLPGSRFEQGFDVFTGLHGPRGHASKDVEAAVVVDAALRFLDARRGLPTFLYVHTMDPHVPYTPPAPFDRKYEPHPAPGHPGVDPRTDYKEPLDRERLIAQYDGDIAYGDREFGRFLDELRARGLYDDALIVFLADHGEEFLDHGQWLHGRSVFDELVRIPLVVKFPGQRFAGRRVAQQVQEVDVLPTVLLEQKLPVPEAPAIAGRPLQRSIEGRGDERPAVSEISHRGFVAHGLRTGRDKYVQRFSPQEDELYFDLRADPREQHDRKAEARERVRALKAPLEGGLAPNLFHHVLRFAGDARYDVELSTRGWIDDVAVQGLGAGESQQLVDQGRRLVLRVTPRPGRPREVSLRLRPRGAPIRLTGARDGRPLAPRDIFVSAAGTHPPAVPLALPDIESEHGDTAEDIFRAPKPTAGPGLWLWLRPIPGRQRMIFGHDAREHLKGLGYIGN
jgi:arylsulfatase A-like enzyme